jgi:hypothetical protein
METFIALVGIVLAAMAIIFQVSGDPSFEPLGLRAILLIGGCIFLAAGFIGLIGLPGKSDIDYLGVLTPLVLGIIFTIIGLRRNNPQAVCITVMLSGAYLALISLANFANLGRMTEFDRFTVLLALPSGIILIYIAFKDLKRMS